MKHLLRITVGKRHALAFCLSRFVLLTVVFLFAASFAQANMTSTANPTSAPTHIF